MVLRDSIADIGIPEACNLGMETFQDPKIQEAQLSRIPETQAYRRMWLVMAGCGLVWCGVAWSDWA